MSRYSEKVERRREEAAREVEKAAKAERHATAAARDAASFIVEDIADALEGFDRAVAHGDAMAAGAVGGVAKNEAMSIRNSLWAMREKLRAMHKRAKLFAAGE